MAGIVRHKKFASFIHLRHVEAFVKATGLGILVGLEQCEVDEAHPHYISNVRAACGAEVNGAFKIYR
ncbi:MAG: hypothetical protein QX188_03470 [Methylococcaceae bacterium]